MALLDAALDAYPAQADLLYARAMVAEELDRLDVLERDLRSIIGRDPNHADALNALGYTLADRTDRLEEAYALLERALDPQADEYHIVDSMGWVLYRMGRYEEAAEHLHRSYAMEPHPEVAAHLGEVLWALGRRDEARAIWNAALQEDPDDEVLVETIERPRLLSRSPFVAKPSWRTPAGIESVSKDGGNRTGRRSRSRSPIRHGSGEHSRRALPASKTAGAPASPVAGADHGPARLPHACLGARTVPGRSR